MSQRSGTPQDALDYAAVSETARVNRTIVGSRTDKIIMTYFFVFAGPQAQKRGGAKNGDKETFGVVDAYMARACLRFEHCESGAIAVPVNVSTTSAPF
jgi:hypothetical protein